MQIDGFLFAFRLTFGRADFDTQTTTGAVFRRGPAERERKWVFAAFSIAPATTSGWAGALASSSDLLITFARITECGQITEALPHWMQRILLPNRNLESEDFRFSHLDVPVG